MSFSNTMGNLHGEAVTDTITVMVVDDERDVRESVADILIARGYDVVCAEDGHAALDLLRRGPRPRVILLDLMMPVMNGWQFRQEQSADPELATIPVVVITANRNLRDISADDVLYKPVKPEHLVDTVARWSAPTRPHAAAPRAVTPEPLHPAIEIAPAGSARVVAADEAGRAAMFSERFVEMLGHDLRNPLSAISITGGILNLRATTPEMGESAARILSVVDRMDLMISHLLDFLRLCLGREIPLDPESIDLADVCRRVARQTPAARREITLTLSGKTDGTWDRRRIELLLATLLVESADSDQGTGPILLSADGQQPDRLRLEVRHEGVTSIDLLSGPKEGLEDLRAVEDEYTRLGLGLFIVKQIVLAHGGKLSVESDETSGTRFTIDLPRYAERTPQ